MYQFDVSSENCYIFYKYTCYIEISRSINTKPKTIVTLEEDRDGLGVGGEVGKDEFLLCDFFGNKMLFKCYQNVKYILNEKRKRNGMKSYNILGCRN